MNTFVKERYWIVETTEGLITEALGVLEDINLDYSPASTVPTVRALFAEQAAVQQAYVSSFRSRTGDFHAIPPLEVADSSVAGYQALFTRLHTEMKDVLSNIADEEWDGATITRDGTFQIPVEMQVSIYREAILICCGKLSVYLRALGVTVGGHWPEWIG